MLCMLLLITCIFLIHKRLKKENVYVADFGGFVRIISLGIIAALTVEFLFLRFATDYLRVISYILYSCLFIVFVVLFIRKIIIVTEKEELMQYTYEMNEQFEDLLYERTKEWRRNEHNDYSFFQYFPNPIVYIDVDGNILKRNSAAEKMIFGDMKHIKELPLHKDFLQGDKKVQDLIENVLKGERRKFDFSVYDVELRTTRYFEVTSIPVHIQAKLDSMYVMLKETTKAMEQEKQIYELAHYDPLTKLANRRTFDKQLTTHLTLADEKDRNVAVMFIDVDRFKMVNDTLGHDVGDELLKEVSRRLVVAVTSTTLVARLGGDEFTILFYDFMNEKELIKMSEIILATFDKPVILQEHVLKVTLSIGIAIYEKGMDSATLMKNADSAMYYVKAKGKNHYQIFNEAIARHYQCQFTIEKDLYNAIEHNELILSYQPLFSSRQSAFSCLEAFVCWKHPSLGIVSSAEFIPIAEETGLIVPIGEWVIREACKKMRDLLSKGYPLMKMFVSISQKQLEKDDFLEKVQSILSEVNIAATYIEFVVMESTLVAREGALKHKIEALRHLGICITIANFGTGHSSLSYLPNFSFDTLKLARELTEGMEENDKRATVVEAVLELAYLLGCKTIVEGIESENQVEYFQHKCHYMQGEYLSKRLSLEEIERFLHEQ
ncbi:putative bifunctional diguanylate cyclase/phosphodiesterase [Priestia taiwanensis]|nr:EAL domain-containing protein [Priestia taiwanensis]